MTEPSSNEMIDIRCSHCKSLLFYAAVSEESDVTIKIKCRNCKQHKNPQAVRTVRLPFRDRGQEKPVASRIGSR